MRIGIGLGLTGRSGASVLPAVSRSITATDPLILSLGAPADNGSQAGHNMHYWGGYANSSVMIEVKARGTITANVMSANGDDITLFVDGVAKQTTVLDNAWEALTAEVGGGDAWHTVELRNTVNGSQYLRARTADMLTFETGAEVYSRSPSQFSTTLVNPNSAGVRLDGFVADGAGLNGYSRTAPFGNSIRFTAAPTAAKPYIWFFASRVIDRVALFEDGVFCDSVLLAPPGGGNLATYDETQIRQWWRLSPTSTDGTEHEYELKTGRLGDNPEFLVEYAPGIAPSFYKISAEGFNAAATPAARGNWAWFGDSIVFGMGNGSGLGQYSWESFAAQITRAKGKNGYQYAVPGYKWSDYEASPSLAGKSIDRLVICLGVNDAINATAIATLKAKVYTVLHRVVGDVNLIHVIPILPATSAGVGGANLTTYRTAISDVIGGGATSAGTLTGGEIAKINLLAPVHSFDAATGDTTDGLHPSQAGMDKLVTDLSALLT